MTALGYDKQLDFTSKKSYPIKDVLIMKPKKTLIFVKMEGTPHEQTDDHDFDFDCIGNYFILYIQLDEKSMDTIFCHFDRFQRH